EERMEQWQTALNRVIVCLVILFIEHEHILPKKAPHPLRIRCLFLFLDCQKFNSPFQTNELFLSGKIILKSLVFGHNRH
ncbi:hypothetical protein, partial [Ileibacterium valens]